MTTSVECDSLYRRESMHNLCCYGWVIHPQPKLRTLLGISFLPMQLDDLVSCICFHSGLCLFQFSGYNWLFQICSSGSCPLYSRSVDKTVLLSRSVVFQICSGSCPLYSHKTVDIPLSVVLDLVLMQGHWLCQICSSGSSPLYSNSVT